MIEDMAVLHITEAELARDVHAVLEKVRKGAEVVIEQDHRPVAVIKAPPAKGRKISEVIAALEASGASATVDEDFARDVEEAINLHREPWNPASLE
jgi:antitoxin (DNA-binding transcriptional repressor) of toxin-antitoxin stability system